MVSFYIELSILQVLMAGQPINTIIHDLKKMFFNLLIPLDRVLGAL